MSSAIALQAPRFSRNSSYGTMRFYHKFPSSLTIHFFYCSLSLQRAYYKLSSKWTAGAASKKKEFSEQLQKLSILETDNYFSPSVIKFNRMQQAVSIQEDKVEFGQFVAREAQVDEEYLLAAWLKAEAQWEDRENDRYAYSHKRKFAQQEFNEMKARCKTQLGEKWVSIVAVKTDILESVVGTLDLSIGYLSHSQTFPGERIKAPLFCLVNGKDSSKYAYISNLCVAKSTRRKGIARNMLQFAIASAKDHGAEQVFVHVHINNKSAQELYQKMGFTVVDAASSQLSSDQTWLLCFENS